MTVGRAEGRRLRLLERRLAWPAPIHDLGVIDSTSLWLKAAAKDGAAVWTVALAREQTAGRGRHGHAWHSPPGGLYFSVVLEAPACLDALHVGVLPLMAGVAIARALAEHGVAARLKWPNDVRVRGRKIAGLLAEQVRRAGQPAIVLGVGINVNWTADAVPTALQGRVTSLRMEQGALVDLDGVAAAALAQLMVCYHALVHGGASVILAQWRQLSEPWWGREVEVRSGAQRVRGTALGIDEDGALLIDQGPEGRHALPAGEVEELYVCDAKGDGDVSE